MDHLDELESQSVFILREAYARLKNLCGVQKSGLVTCRSSDQP